MTFRGLWKALDLDGADLLAGDLVLGLGPEENLAGVVVLGDDGLVIEVPGWTGPEPEPIQHVARYSAFRQCVPEEHGHSTVLALRISGYGNSVEHAALEVERSVMAALAGDPDLRHDIEWLE